MTPELESKMWKFVELVARGNTEFSQLEGMAEELLEAKCHELQNAEGL